MDDVILEVSKILKNLIKLSQKEFIDTILIRIQRLETKVLEAA
ncbi:MAG: hypothetical protein ABWJ99_05835 [Caldimicrobium sp.]